MNFLPSNRGKKEPLIGALPFYSTIILSVVIAVFGVILTILCCVINLNHLVLDDMNAPFNDTKIPGFFHEKTKLIVKFGRYTRFNEYITFFIKFKKKHRDYSLQEQHLEFNYSVLVKNENEENYKYLVNHQLAVGDLDCPMGMEDCIPIQLHHVETCQWGDYKLEVKLKRDIAVMDSLAVYVDIAFRSSTQAWLIVQITFSFIIFIGVLIFTLFYFFYTLAIQKFQYWSVEQWFVLILLILFLFYVNPFYLMDDVFDSSFFTYIIKFIDGVIITTFVAFLFFTLNAMIHFSESRKLAKSKAFYITWGIVSCVYWVCLLAVVLDYRYNRNLQMFFRTVGLGLIVVQLVIYPFNLVRIIFTLKKKLLVYDKLKRIIFIYTTVFVLILMCAVISFFKDPSDEIMKVVYMFAFIIVVFSVAFNNLPSFKERIEIIEDEAEETQRIVTDTGSYEYAEAETEKQSLVASNEIVKDNVAENVNL